MKRSELRLEGGVRLDLDEKGYLLEPLAWTRQVAEHMASLDGVDLAEDHWAILEIYRAYFLQFDIDPPMRAVVKMVREKLGEEKANSRYLYRLFPAGPGTQACRYAGLPRPVSCL